MSTSKRGTIRNRAQHVRGFTLIELLVVVAIITALIAILLPSLNQAIAVAQSAACGSNQRQIGIGMLGYAAENSRLYPAGHTYASSGVAGHTDSWITWISQTRLYTSGTTEVFWCPTADADAKWTKQMGSGQDAFYGYEKDEVRVLWNQKFSYGQNNWGTIDFATPQLGMGSIPDHPTWGYVSMTQIRVPASMIAIGDSLPDGSWDAFIDHNQPAEYPVDRHVGRANIQWADGHVEALPQEDLVDPLNLDAGKRAQWNNDHKAH